MESKGSWIDDVHTASSTDSLEPLRRGSSTWSEKYADAILPYNSLPSRGGAGVTPSSEFSMDVENSGIVPFGSRGGVGLNGVEACGNEFDEGIMMPPNGHQTARSLPQSRAGVEASFSMHNHSRSLPQSRAGHEGGSGDHRNVLPSSAVESLSRADAQFCTSYHTKGLSQKKSSMDGDMSDQNVSHRSTFGSISAPQSGSGETPQTPFQGSERAGTSSDLHTQLNLLRERSWTEQQSLRRQLEDQKSEKESLRKELQSANVRSQELEQVRLVQCTQVIFWLSCAAISREHMRCGHQTSAKATSIKLLHG